MSEIFREIFAQAVEMFDIAARTAEAEAADPKCRPEVLDGLVSLTRSAKGLMLTAKARAQEEAQGA